MSFDAMSTATPKQQQICPLCGRIRPDGIDVQRFPQCGQCSTMQYNCKPAGHPRARRRTKATTPAARCPTGAATHSQRGARSLHSRKTDPCEQESRVTTSENISAELSVREHEACQPSARQIELPNRTLTPVTNPPRSVELRHMCRMQVVSAFLDIHCPDELGAQPATYLRPMLLRALPRLTLDCPMLQNSIEAVVLSGLAQYSSDRTLEHNARVKYTVALNHLNQHLSKARASGYQSSVLLTIMLGLLYEQFRTYKSASGKDAVMAHLFGAMRYLEMAGPEAIKTPIDRLLLFNVRMMSMYIGFVSRRKIYFANDRWIEILQSGPYDIGITACSLLDYGLQIPGILQRCDVLIDGCSALNSRSQDARCNVEEISRLAKDLRRQISTLRSALDAWHADHALSSNASLCCPKPFAKSDAMADLPKGYNRHGKTGVPDEEVYHAHFWTYCLMLDCTTLRMEQRIAVLTIDHVKELQASARQMAKNLVETQRWPDESSSAFHRNEFESTFVMALTYFQEQGLTADVESIMESFVRHHERLESLLHPLAATVHVRSHFHATEVDVAQWANLIEHLGGSWASAGSQPSEVPTDQYDLSSGRCIDVMWKQWAV